MPLFSHAGCYDIASGVINREIT